MIPIYKAETIEDGDFEFGLLRDKRQTDGTLISYTINGYSIDIETLHISFNDGKSWVCVNDLEIYECVDFHLKASGVRYKHDIKQPPNGSIFTIITDKGR